jgi:hypothetical protein
MKRISVFSGSSPGAREDYALAAAALGRELARRSIGMVYGGASVGLMAVAADAALEAGGQVTGIIPRFLVDREIAHSGLTELRIVDSMHERKATMADLSDGFIALPGGLGTIEELLEILTWAQVRLHEKPCGVLNVCGYFDPLRAMLEHAVTERFLRREHAGMLLTAQTPKELLDRFEAWQPPAVEKWLDRG